MIDASRRPIAIDDYWDIAQIVDVQIARSTIAVVVRSLDEERNARRSAVWIVSGPGAAHRLTHESEDASEPRWSPDGSLLMLRSCAGESASRLLVVDPSNRARREFSCGGSPRSVAWSPDGTEICFVADIPVDDARMAAEREWLAAHPIASRSPPLRRLTSRRSRTDGRGYRDAGAGLFRFATASAAEPARLAASEFDDVDPAWSPDGRRIAFVSNRSPDRRIESERNIWTIDLATEKLTSLTAGFWMWGPLAWSPDGRHIACFGMRALRVPLAMQLWIVAADGSGAVTGSAGFGAHLWPHGAPLWAPDGEQVLAAGAIGNDGTIVAYDRRTNEGRVIMTADAVPGLLQRSSDGTRIVAAVSSAVSPSALVAFDPRDGSAQPLFDPNARWLAGRAAATTRRVSFTTSDGLTIGGWLITPAGAGPHPCILDVHYGPNAAWGPTFAFNAQVLAARGFATLLVNPRGSAGYGDAFAAAADFGHADFADLQLALDELIAQGVIDADRVGIMGLSYGGFMALWATTQTRRFRAAVSINGISNQLSWYLLSDTGLFFYRDRFGDPFADDAALQRYWQHSPLAFCTAIETPILLLASEDDWRCPIDQSEQLFGALVARGKPTELIRVPNAAHDLIGTAAPHHGYLAVAAIGDWFERYLR